MLNGWEIGAIFVFVLVFFGSSKIPDVARNVGKAMREFKRVTGEIRDELDKAADAATAPPPSPRPQHIAATAAENPMEMSAAEHLPAEDKRENNDPLI